MDMDGAVVHSWPGVRVSGRARLLPSGHLAVISSRGRFREYDWEGQRTWHFRPARAAHILHHDFALLRNGNYLLLVRRPVRGTDFLLEVNRSREEVWRWESREGIQEDLWRAQKIAEDFANVDHDSTHMNSVHELPPNKWFDEGHEEFRPGNILVSARNLNALYIVARPSGEVVWKHYDGLDYQHEASMVPRGVPGAGNIVFFNNGYHNIESYRQSSIVELNPLERWVVWRYRSPGFFSSVEGVQQVLPSGNVLVTSSRGGRVFELTGDRQVVWQWSPPYLPMRVSRYPYDFCPQFASLGPPSERPVRRRDPEQYVDADLHSFALAHDRRLVETGNGRVSLLRWRNGCRTVRLPEDAVLDVGYGVDRRGRCEPGERQPARFGVSIRPPAAEASEDLLERTLDVSRFGAEDPDAPDAPVLLHRETLSLARYGRQTVDICVMLASASGTPPPPCFVWEAPKVRPLAGHRAEPIGDTDDAEVLEHQRRQLEALGYVN
jgi:hypothetical protein